jgi:hypothetical protein
MHASAMASALVGAGRCFAAAVAGKAMAKVSMKAASKVLAKAAAKQGLGRPGQRQPVRPWAPSFLVSAPPWGRWRERSPVWCWAWALTGRRFMPKNC